MPEYDQKDGRPIRWLHSLGFRLLAGILLLVVVFVWWIGVWAESKIEAMLRDDVRAEAMTLARNQIAGLKTLMLHGDGQLVSEWLTRMHGQQDIESIRVYRRNGEQAFTDLKTLRAVNAYIGEDRFQRAFVEADREHPPRMEDVRRAAQGEIRWREEGNQHVQLLMPIRRDDECLRCHGYEDDPVRGVLYIRLSTRAAEQAIDDFRHNALLFSALFAVLLLAATWCFLHALVLSPMRALLDSIHRLVGNGEAAARALPVERGDEFGELARAFVELERAWALREHRLQLILQHIPDGVLTVNEKGEVLTGNQAASDMLGIPPDELVHRRVLEYLYPPARTRRSDVPSLAEHGIAALAETVRECVARSADNGLFPLELEVRPFHIDYMLFMRERAMYDLDRHGRFLVFLRDLTIRKRAEGEMRLLSAVVNQATDAILITDPAGVIEYVNVAFCRITQYTREEVIGKKPSILKSGEFDEAYYQRMWQSLLDGKVWKDVFVNRRKDGTHYHAEQTIAPIFDGYGNISHLVSIQRDVTRERELQTQMEHLQRLESLGVLAGGIAHDFNNILAVVMGNAELLRMQMEGSPQGTTSLDAIVSACNRGAALCRELMAYAGKGKREVQWINLKNLFAELNHLLQVTVPKHIRLEFDMDEDLPGIRADVMQLEQVMMNLLINAREAIGSQPGKIVVRGRRVRATPEMLQRMYHDQLPESMDFVELTVRDDGCGMTDEVRARIFDPFYTTKFTGRGLGMSAVLGIIQAHHGAIRCDSEPGVGTTFTILFPVAEHGEGAAAGDAGAVRLDVPKGATLLLVEDEPAILDVLQHLLSQAGLHVHGYTHGEDALRNFRAHRSRIDLVMLDLSMPEMDGATLLRHLRAEGLQVPVIVFSGEGEEEARRKLQGLVFDALISKPFQHHALLAEIGRLLRRCGSKRDEPRA